MPDRYGAPIPGLAGSALHQAAVDLHDKHRDAGGACAACGRQVPCPIRCRAEWVIAAAGEVREVVGWAIGGRRVQGPPEGYVYDRS